MVYLASRKTYVAFAPQRWIATHLLSVCAVTAVGRGIGTLLMERAKAQLGSPVRLYTFQANAGARRFYERHGFRAITPGDGSGNEK